MDCRAAWSTTAPVGRRLFADPESIAKQVDTLSGLLPGGALAIIGERVKRIASKPHSALGFGSATGLAVALWSANAGVKAMLDALTVVYKEEEKRGFVMLNAVSLVFTSGTLLVILLALGAVVAIRPHCGRQARPRCIKP